jgi:hypothetical protein
MTPPAATPSPAQARLKAASIVLKRSAVEKGDLAISALEELARRTAKELGQDDPVTLEIRLRLEESVALTRPAQDSIEAFRHLQARCESSLGDAHPVAVSARSDHALYLRKAGKVDEGIELYRDELVKQVESFGEKAYPTCLSRLNLAVALRDRGTNSDSAEAEMLIDQEVRIRKEEFGEEHAFTWVAYNSKANLLLDLAERSTDPETVMALARKAYELADMVARRRRARLGSRHPSTLRAWRAEARALIQLGESERAAWLLWRIHSVESATFQADPGQTEYLLAQALAASGSDDDLAQAITHARNALEILSDRLGDWSFRTKAARALLESVSSRNSGEGNH